MHGVVFYLCGRSITDALSPRESEETGRRPGESRGPGLKWFAHFVRDLKQLIAGSSAPALWVTFVSAKVTKTLHSGARENSFAPGVRRSAAHPFGGMEVHRNSTTTPPHPPDACQLAGRTRRASGSIKSLATPPRRAAMLGGVYGACKYLDYFAFTTCSA